MDEPETEAQQVARFVHRYQHLVWRKGLGLMPEHEFIAECWMPLQVPEWASESASRGESGAHWCPRITDGLWARG